MLFIRTNTSYKCFNNGLYFARICDGIRMGNDNGFIDFKDIKDCFDFSKELEKSFRSMRLSHCDYLVFSRKYKVVYEQDICSISRKQYDISIDRIEKDKIVKAMRTIPEALFRNRLLDKIRVY